MINKCSTLEKPSFIHSFFHPSMAKFSSSSKLSISPPLLLVVVVVLVSTITCCNGDHVPRFFILGDSLVDVGNNNYIFSIAQANVMPNGIDFAPAGHKPTGRFCNGKTVADLIVDQFRAACYPPPNLGPGAKDAVTKCGISYASGGGGILNKTGYVFIGRINMDAQIDSYASTRHDLIASIGNEKATELLHTAFFPIIMGSNDFLDNYLVPLIGTQKVIPPEVFIGQLIERFRRQITRLYSLDARRFLVVNVAPIGCIPFQVGISGGKCSEETNQLARNFNGKLKGMINELTVKLPQAVIVVADIYNVLDHILKNSVSYGFEVKDKGCCVVDGALSIILPCGPKSTVCSDRSKYVFWDPFHPTEATNKIIAELLLNGGPEYIYPMNIRQTMIKYGY